MTKKVLNTTFAVEAARSRHVDRVSLSDLRATLGVRRSPPAPKAGEDESSFRLRLRYHAATEAVRSLLFDLESLRPISENPEAALVEDLRLLAQDIQLAEMIGGADERRAVRIVDTARLTLQRDVDSSWAHVPWSEKLALALASAPELNVIRLSDWDDAREKFRSVRPSKRGGPRTRGQQIETWYRVVFDLLKEHSLTDASTADNMLRAYNDVVKGRATSNRM